MKYFTLTTGAKMPMAGIGTFMISSADAEVAVESALRSGVRLIDTANAYMNESATGRGIMNSGVANACTGQKGNEYCMVTAQAAAEALNLEPKQILL